MSWVATAIATSAVIGAGTTLYTQKKQQEGQEDAEEEAEKTRIAAEKARQEADEEGKGIGSLGKVDLAIDDELDEDLRLKKSNRISI